ncbi:MAG TPA: ATP-binding protein [Armatimonadota bacterium]
MRELSLHILDIIQNSIAANATRILVRVEANEKSDRLAVRIEDNGKGMSPEFVARVLDPFVTTRTTRRVGLGLPMLASAAQACGGDISVKSNVGTGTTVEVWFKLSHIDRAPLGDITSTIVNNVAANPDIEFRYEHVVNDRNFSLDTKDMNGWLDGVPLNNPLVVDWMRAYMREGIQRTGIID